MYLYPLISCLNQLLPLRINKRTRPSPSPPHFSPSSSPSTSQLPPSSSIPNTSHSSYDERSKRNSTRMSDVEARIGLSLLQDLANGMDSDSDDGDGQWSKPDPVAGTPDFDSYAISLSRGTQERQIRYGDSRKQGRRARLRWIRRRLRGKIAGRHGETCRDCGIYTLIVCDIYQESIARRILLTPTPTKP